MSFESEKSIVFQDDTYRITRIAFPDPTDGQEKEHLAIERRASDYHGVPIWESVGVFAEDQHEIIDILFHVLKNAHI